MMATDGVAMCGIIEVGLRRCTARGRREKHIGMHIEELLVQENWDHRLSGMGVELWNNGCPGGMSCKILLSTGCDLHTQFHFIRWRLPVAVGVQVPMAHGFCCWRSLSWGCCPGGAVSCLVNVLGGSWCDIASCSLDLASRGMVW